MTKGRIIFIVVLMSLASFGLMGFQYYWIKNAIRINQERFNQNIVQVLGSTVEELEQGETSGIILKELIRDPRLHERIDPIEFNIRAASSYNTRRSIADTMFAPIPEVSATFRRMLLSHGLDIAYLEELEEFLANMTPEMASKLFTPDEMTILLQEKERQLEFLNKNPKGFSVQPLSIPMAGRFRAEVNVSKDIMTKIRKTNVRIDLMNQVFRELAEKQQVILDRLDTAQVRALITENLRKKGIQDNFELGLLDDNGKILPIGNVSDIAALRRKGTQAKLFPNDILGRDNFIYIFFPNKNSRVIRQIWLPISSSILFILVIITCFIYAIKVILRQKALSDTKNDFINNMTHEFKTPLATVSLAVEALQDPGLSGQDRFRTRYLGIIKDENKRLVTQVEKVLQAAALDKKDFRLKIEPINLSELLENAVDHISLQVEKREGKIELISNLKNNKIEGDAFHLTHIFNNLLDNANKYSPKKPLIRVEVTETKDQVAVSIQDQGIGMGKEVQRKIFDKFYRVPTGNLHDVKGFGLGLSYVRTMLEAHKGDIHVISESGKGSTFTINLPKKQ